MKANLRNRVSDNMNMSMFCLSIELTRKCNLSCDFCSRGVAQNMDITKEIIDKTLDEVQNVPIYRLRIHGGEPLLAPEMFSYLADEIIRRNIIVDGVTIFSNGTIRDEKIKEAMEKLTDYLVEKESEFLSRFVVFFPEYISSYETTEDKKVSLIISTYHHDNAKSVAETIMYYNQIDNPYFSAISQYKKRPDVKSDIIAIEGCAEKNYKNIITDKPNIENIRIIYNNYDIITETDDNHIFVNKTLTVSANGNVFPGCLMSYENVDKRPMFNILNCNKDFLKRIDTFCWQNPLFKKGSAFRSFYLALKWAEEHNVDVVNNSKLTAESCDYLNRYLVIYEKTVVDLHKMVPYLNHTECKLMALSKVCLDILNSASGATAKKDVTLFIRHFISACFDVENDLIDYFTNEYWLRSFILGLSETNNKRKKQIK